jgi:hypothetical protein
MGECVFGFLRREGKATAFVSINDEIIDPCLPNSARANSVLTVRGSGTTMAPAQSPLFIPPPSLDLFISSGFYRLGFAFQVVEVEIEETSCDGHVRRERAPLPVLATGPFEDIPLPASGLTLSGTWRFRDPVTELELETTWNLSPTRYDPEDDPCQQPGCTIAAQNQGLGEAVGIVGTPFSLHYQSDRMPGRAGANSLAIAHARHLGGWSLNVHHAYDPNGGALYLGDGARRSADDFGGFLSVTT